MRMRRDRATRRKRTAKQKVLVAGYERLNRKEKKAANGVISTLRKNGYNVEKV